jgi:hypothetical protein
MILSPYFSEIQKFTQTWVLVILIFVVLLMSRFVFRLLKDEKISKINPLFFLIFLIPLAAVFLTFSMRLETTIDDGGISYRFYPLHMKANKIDWGNIDSVYIRKYSPAREYGGRGIRAGKSGRAYDVSGDIGLQIIFKDKDREKLLIGTIKPEEMKKVLETLANTRQISCYHQ